MTFFANSGVAWPNHEKDTKWAGAQSLDAFSRIWRLLADLEIRSENIVKDVDISHSVDALQEASKVYARVADSFGDSPIYPLTPAEIELVGFNILPSRRIYEDRYYWRDSFFGLFLTSRLSLGPLYRELAQRTAHLASSISAFETKRPDGVLVPQAFQFMKQIEALAILGRVIAVLNQRSPQ